MLCCKCNVFWTCFVVLQSILFTKHTFWASVLRFCVPEGFFNTLDGLATSSELVWYGKKACKQCKKQLRRQAKKVS